MRVLIVEDQVLLRDGLTRMLTAYGMDVATTWLTNALGTGGPEAARQIIHRDGGTAAVMSRFFEALVNESKQTPYPFASD